MIDSDMEEKKTSRINLEDVSAECVKALLEYLYTFKISEGRNCSKLAMELFQVAHKYHVRQLEQGLGKILLKQVNTWYHVDAALQLFQFSRNVEEHNGLKIKCVQVLKLWVKLKIIGDFIFYLYLESGLWKHYKLINSVLYYNRKSDELLNSENYKKLFSEDLATAMELCAISLKE